MVDGFLGNRGLTPGAPRLEAPESAWLDLMSVAGLAGPGLSIQRITSIERQVGGPKARQGRALSERRPVTRGSRRLKMASVDHARA
jgi:hypothetical protein